MISAKNINLLEIKLKNEDVYYKDELLILKTGITDAIDCSQKDENFIKINIDATLSSNNRLKEVILFINRLYPTIFLINEENTLHINIDSESKFFNSNGEKITKNSLNKKSRILCSIFIKKGIIYLHQCMKL